MKITTNIVAISLMAVLISGCNENDADTKSPSQVAAKVNGQEVTVHQVNQILKTIPNQANQSTQDMANQILDRLINQEILLQQAMQLKLDRDPEVLSAIELAKRKVLIDAYAAKILQGASNPDEAKIKAYFEQNPKFFSDRKVFNYTQFLIKATGQEADVLIEAFKSTNDIESLQNILNDKKLAYKLSRLTTPSEKLAKPLLEPMYSIKEGDIGYLKMDDGLLVVKLNAVIPEAVTYEVAKPAIANHLMTEARNQQSSKLVNDLRSQAQIEYVGSFSPIEKPNSEKK